MAQGRVLSRYPDDQRLDRYSSGRSSWPTPAFLQSLHREDDRLLGLATGILAHRGNVHMREAAMNKARLRESEVVLKRNQTN
jgi:hypothetical protein